MAYLKSMNNIIQYGKYYIEKQFCNVWQTSHHISEDLRSGFNKAVVETALRMRGFIIKDHMERSHFIAMN